MPVTVLGSRLSREGLTPFGSLIACVSLNNLFHTSLRRTGVRQISGSSLYSLPRKGCGKICCFHTVLFTTRCKVPTKDLSKQEVRPDSETSTSVLVAAIKPSTTSSSLPGLPSALNKIAGPGPIPDETPSLPRGLQALTLTYSAFPIKFIL